MEAEGDWDKVSKFVDKQLELLNDERDAEIEQTRALQEGYSPKVLCSKLIPTPQPRGWSKGD
jgi:hypothetical protein